MRQLAITRLLRLVLPAIALPFLACERPTEPATDANALPPHLSVVADITVTDLGTLGGTFSSALAVNDLGQVVGLSMTAAKESHAFLWEAGTMTDLGTLGGSEARAVAVNDLGQVVGVSMTAAGESHGALWRTLRPATPEEEITILHAAVNDLVTAGALSPGPAKALATTLDAATRLLNQGNTAGAARLLHAFINQVRAFIQAGVLPTADGQRLIDAAQNAINQLTAAP